MANNYAPVIDANGITANDFATNLEQLTADFQHIFGADTYLGNDSQDGQWVGVLAQAITDSGNSVVASYQARSPATAQGNGLSSVVKINGLQRLVPSYSIVPANIVGQAGKTVPNGLVRDAAGNVWALPTGVTFPGGGSLAVTLTCTVAGAIALANDTALQIATPVAGWQTCTTTASAAPGAPVESDGALRVRQSNSTGQPATTILESIWSDIENLPGVTRVQGYENNGTATDGNGVPAGQFAFVVEGGNVADIQAAIALKAPPGIGSYGTTSTTVVNSKGSSKVVAFSVPTESTFAVALTISAGGNWSATAKPLIQAAVAAYLNALPIGERVSYTQLIVPAYILNSAFAGSFSITTMTITKNGGGAVSADISMAWNEAATCSPTAVTFSGV